MNSITAHLMEQPKSFEPLFQQRHFEGRTFPIADEWCEGYRHGVELAGAEWRSGGEKIAMLLEPIYAFTEASGWPAHEKGEDEMNALRQSGPNARAIQAYWHVCSRAFRARAMSAAGRRRQLSQQAAGAKLLEPH